MLPSGWPAAALVQRLGTISVDRLSPKQPAVRCLRQPRRQRSSTRREFVTLVKTLLTLPVISLLAMAAFADDAAPPPHAGAMAACKQDVQTLCADVQRGGGRIMECLKSHADKVSPGCKAAVQAAHDRRAQQPPAGAPQTN
jgi:hypothetical protein